MKIDLDKIKDVAFPPRRYSEIRKFYLETHRIPHEEVRLLYGIREYLGDFCKNYLEIGVLGGWSMVLATQSHFPCHFYGIDLFEEYLKINESGNDYTDDYKILSFKSVENNIMRFNIFNHNLNLIKANSHDNKVIEQFRSMEKFQMLFIDGDHSDDGVKKDFESYECCVESGGVVVFDDYDYSGVKKVVDELNLEEWEKIGLMETKLFVIQKK